MLIISRKKDQKIVVAEEIEITILDVGRNRVRFGIKAPKHIPILTRTKTAELEPVGVGHEVSSRHETVTAGTPVSKASVG